MSIKTMTVADLSVPTISGRGDFTGRGTVVPTPAVPCEKEEQIQNLQEVITRRDTEIERLKKVNKELNRDLSHCLYEQINK